MNPVLLKELRLGLREKRIFILQLLYLLILLALTFWLLPNLFRDSHVDRLSEHGRVLFIFLYFIQLLLLVVTAPALTCGSLSGERERHSLDMVLASRLSSFELVIGKLGFAAYYLLLLLFSGLPLTSLCFFLGGVSLGEALCCYLELFLFAMVAACFGLFTSAREQRSNYATAQSYLMVLLGCFTLPFYGVLRFEHEPAHISLGSWGELEIWHAFWGLALYLIALVVLKASFRLRPQVATLRRMAWAYLALAVYVAFWLTATMFEDLSTPNHPAGVLLSFQLLSAGFFLNQPSLDSPRQLLAFRRSLFSRWPFWLLWFGLVSLVPLLLDLKEAVGMGLFLLLFYPLMVLQFQRAFLPRWQFAWVYYLGLALQQLLMFLLSMTQASSQSLCWLSPFTALWGALQVDDPKMLTWPVLLLYPGLTLVFALLAAWRSRRALP